MPPPTTAHDQGGTDDLHTGIDLVPRGARPDLARVCTARIAALTTWFGLTDGLAAQLWVFALSSLLLLVFLRRRIKSRLSGYTSEVQDPNVNLDEFRGQRITVLAAITPGQTGGRVEYKGAGWAAVSDSTLAAGEQAIIVGVDGITLQVRPLPVDDVVDDHPLREG